MNPRRPTPAGPKPAPFDLARAPPRPVLGAGRLRGQWVDGWGLNALTLLGIRGASMVLCYFFFGFCLIMLSRLI